MRCDWQTRPIEMSSATLVAVGPGRPEVERATTVRISGDARPESATIVSLDAFDGPLALLLALIEQRELDIRTVRLGELAAAYLDALATLSGDRLPHLSAFTAVAAQLILIKSRAILPEPPVVDAPSAEDAADPAEELRRRLLLYRAFRDAGQLLAARMADGRLYHREATAHSAEEAAAAFPAGPAYDPHSLVRALERTARLAPPPVAPPEVVARIVTLSECAELIREALSRAPSVVLQDLLRGVTDRVVMAVTFLALLELVKRRELTVEQAEPWGPIHCRRLQTAGGT
jgi:segregation and condensation protein A